ncbi:L-Aspartase-like protein [Emericellopsis atlantica]|uniref:L-Aspartase-like protein n=1 Tax=Emericellopsis atlantica TaxID=2614577 RepID=A0A9P8CTJ9_9HYPO|nr:L-Aspartase-like protein [Emericellopsis atlantica]KAG9256906.1 L-Aspartase-like protein [Emericellopsis atlantica]
MTGAKTAEHANSTLSLWRNLQSIKKSLKPVVLDGTALTIPDVIAVARHAVQPSISRDEELAKRLQRSVECLSAYLAKETVVYGVNTGFGGSADVRTDDMLDLQIGLLQHQNCAIVSPHDKDVNNNAERLPSDVMQPEWVRGAMVTRANQNIRGHSAVRLEVLDGLIAMLNKDIVPLVPLRGTISASGDLMPMGYIAGALMGNPDVFVQVGRGKQARVLPASQALQETGLYTTGLGPKEGLALINGTAPSCSLASLVLYDAQQLAYLSQVCTAFASEAMAGNVDWAAPFIHAIRPHPGQIEVAANIRRALRGSQLVVGLEERKHSGNGLWQDRYSTRTAPQWIGPYLEDLLLAQRQIETELNSTSDNPLVDATPMPGCPPPSGEVFSGGNFQAVAITSAMDKTRLALQMIGRMLFSQVSEIIHPSTNNGLEANLNASDKANFTFKGMDINMSAYMSELAALAHPVSAHVMSAEMHNQGINSLAFVSARRTMEAVNIVRMMAACHLYVCTQAVDLRACHLLFFDEVSKKLANAGMGISEDGHKKIMEAIELAWKAANESHWCDRIKPTSDALWSVLAKLLAGEGQSGSLLASLADWHSKIAAIVEETAKGIFYPNLAITTRHVASLLGDGTAPIYNHIRETLEVPLHCGLDDDPLYCHRRGLPYEKKKTIGSWLGFVHESLKDELMDMVMRGLDGGIDVRRNGVTVGAVNGAKETNGTNSH